MLDIHVLRYNSNPEWEAYCRSSIKHAIERALYPVEVHYLDGEPGHIGRGRAAGYALGTHPYVTYVDNDDYLLVDALEAMADALAKGPDVVFSGELELKNGYVLAGSYGHHLITFRREHVIDHTKWAVCGDLAQTNRLKSEVSIHLPHRGYVHRVYESAGRLLRREHYDELERACRT